MQQITPTSVSRNKALSFVSGIVLLLLLSWQVNLKTTALEKSFVGVNQSIIDVTEIGIDISDFDHAIMTSTLVFGELTGWVEAITDLNFKPANSIFVPQARAPPALL
tara:strand:+ start:2633 stop:2953 length:321 start_codon:yes stop_codon:yes gene_type:complete